jgi:hypothetical protein
MFSATFVLSALRFVDHGDGGAAFLMTLFFLSSHMCGNILTRIFHEKPGCSEAPVRPATLRELAVTGRPNIMMNGPSTRLLARAALIAPASEPAHHVHE